METQTLTEGNNVGHKSIHNTTKNRATVILLLRKIVQLHLSASGARVGTWSAAGMPAFIAWRRVKVVPRWGAGDPRTEALGGSLREPTAAGSVRHGKQQKKNRGREGHFLEALELHQTQINHVQKKP